MQPPAAPGTGRAEGRGSKAGSPGIPGHRLLPPADVRGMCPRDPTRAPSGTPGTGKGRTPPAGACAPNHGIVSPPFYPRDTHHSQARTGFLKANCLLQSPLNTTRPRDPVHTWMLYGGCQGSPDPESAVDALRESSAILKALAAGSSPQYPRQEGLGRRQRVPALGLLPAPTAHAPASVAEELRQRRGSLFFFVIVFFFYFFLKFPQKVRNSHAENDSRGKRGFPALELAQPQQLPEPACTSPRMGVLHAPVAPGNSGHPANDVLPK